MDRLAWRHWYDGKWSTKVFMRRHRVVLSPVMDFQPILSLSARDIIRRLGWDR